MPPRRQKSPLLSLYVNYSDLSHTTYFVTITLQTYYRYNTEQVHRMADFGVFLFTIVFIE